MFHIHNRSLLYFTEHFFSEGLRAYPYEEVFEETNAVTLELDNLGNIVGPELAPNSSPPEKVYHAMAGIGILRAEPSVTSYGEIYISYFFPDDQKTYIVTQDPNRGMTMDSNYDVFLKE